MPLIFNQKVLATLICTCLLSFTSVASGAAPKADLWPFWNKSDDLNATKIDHSKWQTILDKYVKKSDEDGFNKVDYRSVRSSDKQLLDNYIVDLSSLSIRSYSRAEQFAYWVNLYNAVTMQLILDNYPVKSITKLGGFFSFGPWDEDIMTIELQKVSLNDIEHRILRPIWKDKRIHYVVNCASYGCPQLSKIAFTAKNTQEQLQSAEKAYILHPRGFQMKGETVIMSSIYDWYQVDFADNPQDIVKSFKKFFPEEEQQERFDSWLGLSKSRQKIIYEYDWSLNQL